MPLTSPWPSKIMKEKGIHEGCMEQVDRMMRTRPVRRQTWRWDEQAGTRAWMTGTA